MTLSPEERAEALLANMDSGSLFMAWSEGALVSAIATAIRQACNEKLEEAAALADREAECTSYDEAGRCAESAFMRLSEGILALKDTTP